MWKKIGKTAAAGLAFLLALTMSEQAGSGVYQWLEEKHMALLCQYASDGQFSENIYFSGETEARFGVPGQLEGIVPGADGNLAGAAGKVLAEQWEAAGILSRNQSYLDYLREQGASLSGLFSFCERIAGIRGNLIYAVRYLFFLLWVIFLHMLMRCRPALYFAMGVLCILATSIKLSGKLAAVFLFGSSALNQTLSDGILPSLLEAMLTFLIFDITIAALEKNRLSRKVEALYQDLPALQVLIVHLAGRAEQGGVYRSDISRLLPHFHAYAQSGKRSRKKALRLIRAIEALSGPHTNRSFLEAAVELQALLPGR